MHPLEPYLHQAAAVTRRHFLGRFGLGLGAMALQSLVPPAKANAATEENPLAPKVPLLPVKAKHVIYLHMAGGPSQVDLFDYKPALARYDGKPCPEEYLKGQRFAFLRGVPKVLASPFKWAQHGDSGTWMSQLWEHLPQRLGDLAMVRSLTTEQINHAPAQRLLHTGSQLLGGASLGSWAAYGLGTENQNLPAFIVLTSGGQAPDAGVSLWSNGFLPGVYQGVCCRSDGEPIMYLPNPPGLDRTGRRETLDALRTLNQMQAQSVNDPETVTRIAQYELAFRMQMSVPEATDLSKEPQHVLDLYGAQPGKSGPGKDATDPAFANNCLLARRLVERGVRFVQLYDWGWDHHGFNDENQIHKALPVKVRQIDRALSGLITDLKQRGLLESTLVLWGGEFGRTPMLQKDEKNPFLGRDHQPTAFTMLLAGGGVKSGIVYGETDDFGCRAVNNPVTIHDLQALILTQLGLDPFKLLYRTEGLDQRLIGVEGRASVPRGLLA